MTLAMNPSKAAGLASMLCLLSPLALRAEVPRLPAGQGAALFAAPSGTAPVYPSDADLIDTVTPAVVSVFPARIVEGPDAENPLDQFFNRDRSAPKGNGGDGGSRENERVQGVGSGVVISADGWVVTNSHVIHLQNGKQADAISVEFADRRRYDAEVVGDDPLTDLALLKIKATGLPFLKLADSDSVRVGDPVYAVGNPFKIGITATKGMVSAVRRANLDLTSGGFESYIQTDAAINPGNSGGLLADRHGRLAGINTAIWGAAGRFNVGIGFAIPSNLVRNVVTQLAEQGKVERGFFGWQIEEPLRKDIEVAGLVSMAGAKLGQVMEGGPAAVAGLKAGDIVLEASGGKVYARGDLRFIASMVRPGEALPVIYQRAGQKLTTTLTAGRNDPQAVPAGSTFRLDSLPGIDFRKGRKGLVVEQIGKKEKAKTGLAVGMEIVEINGKPVLDAVAAGAALVEGVNQVKARTGAEEQTLAIRLPLNAERE
jgi:S1-C subfamily serine protease